MQPRGAVRCTHAARKRRFRGAEGSGRAWWFGSTSTHVICRGHGVSACTGRNAHCTMSAGGGWTKSHPKALQGAVRQPATRTSMRRHPATARAACGRTRCRGRCTSPARQSLPCRLHCEALYAACCHVALHDARCTSSCCVCLMHAAMLQCCDIACRRNEMRFSARSRHCLRVSAPV